MKEFVILADNGCALEKQYRERWGIDGIVYGNIFYPDGHSEKGDIDWERHTPEEYFGSMVDKKFFYKTSCANLDEIKNLMEPFAKEGKDILMVCLSTGVSGTYGFAVKAGEELSAKYPKVTIKVVDSLRYSTSFGLELIYASNLRKQGKDVNEVAAWLEENKGCFHQIGIMDDLFFLARNGRISKAAAFMGNLVGVEPMADFNDKGLAEVVGKGKGKKKSLKICVDYVKETIVNPEDQIIFINHSLREKEAMLLKQLVEENLKVKEIIVTSVDQTCGANIGPGLAAVFYFGKKISPELAEEKELMSRLLK